MSTPKQHHYAVDIVWTGNLGTGTSAYRAYSRDHRIAAGAKPAIPASSDPAFRGDPSRYNPEDLLVASVSSCHMLWYLHLAAEARLVVTEYVDHAAGTMVEAADGSGRFIEIVLKPRVVLAAGGDAAAARALHERAHHMCFVANSVNFPIRCEPDIEVTQP